jgi:hypothetical protein
LLLELNYAGIAADGAALLPGKEYRGPMRVLCSASLFSLAKLKNDNSLQEKPHLKIMHDVADVFASQIFANQSAS